MTLLLSVTVPGQPIPQGSMTPFIHAKTGRVVSPQKRTLVEWRETVAWHARQNGAPAEPTSNPVRVRLQFMLPRPRSHFGTGRNSGVLKQSAPLWPVGRPDLDKLVRAILDALTGVTWSDDSQVVDIDAFKAWDDQPGVHIEIHTVGKAEERVA